MRTKKQAEILAQEDPLMKFVDDPAIALGMVISELRFRKNRDEATGYCTPRSLRTLYRAAKLEMPDALRLSLKKKEQTFEMCRSDLLHLAVSAAKNENESIADCIIAMARDLPVRRLTTVLNDKSGVLAEVKQRAEKTIAYEKKTADELKALGALDAEKRIPTLRQSMNELVLAEISRFASYNRLLQEVDLNRSKVTKGNIIHLCCSQKFVEALSNACVPGVGTFKVDSSQESVILHAPSFPRPHVSRAKPENWPFPTGGFGID